MEKTPIIAINRLTGKPFGLEEDVGKKGEESSQVPNLGFGEFGDTASTVAAGIALNEEGAKKQINRP